MRKLLFAIIALLLPVEVLASDNQENYKYVYVQELFAYNDGTNDILAGNNKKGEEELFDAYQYSVFLLNNTKGELAIKNKEFYWNLFNYLQNYFDKHPDLNMSNLQ